MTDTTQPAGALPEPAGYIRLPGVPGLCCDGYSAAQMRAMMAERDAAREELACWRDAHEHYRSLSLEMAEKRDYMREERDSLAAQVKQLAGAHVAWLDERDALRQKLDTACDALAHYQHGGSEYRKIAARALEAIGSSIPPDAREGREPLPASHAEFWLANRSKILDAIAREGLTLVSNRYGFELLKLGKMEAQSGPVGTSAESVTVKDACAKVCGTFPSFGGTSAEGADHA